MSCTISAWGTGTGKGGEEQALRIQLKRERHSSTEEYGLRSQVSGLYRQKYGDWPEHLGSSYEGEDEPEVADLGGGKEAGAETSDVPAGEPSGG